MIAASSSRSATLAIASCSSEPAMTSNRSPDEFSMLESTPRVCRDSSGSVETTATVVWLDTLVELDLGPAEAGAQDPGARHLTDPRQPVIALDREVDKPSPGRPANLAERAADHDPATVHDRDRLAQRLDSLHLVGRE